MPSPRTIKRYANRKLYDTEKSVYVTLEQIADMVRAKEDLRIIDNTTKEDLTSVTLAQIIFEEEKRKRLLPLSALKRIIQTGGESISDFVTQLSKDLDEHVGRVFRRASEEKESLPEASVDRAGHDDPAAFPDPSGAAAPFVTDAFREWLETSQQTYKEWESKIDDQIHKLLDRMSPLAPLEKEVARLSDSLQAIEERVERLEGGRSGPSSK